MGGEELLPSLCSWLLLNLAFLAWFEAAPLRVPGNNPLSRLLAPLLITQVSTSLLLSLPLGLDPRGSTWMGDCNLQPLRRACSFPVCLSPL